MVILITGASSGIGKETARLLSSKGHVVYGAARRIEKMDDLRTYNVKLLSMDLTDDESMTSAINEILRKENKLDVLINSAGYGSLGALEDVPISEARHQFEVNVFGMARLIQLVLPQMRKQHSGKIINISSSGGFFGEPHASWYHATKYAVEGLSDSLRMEVKEFGIDVILIRPGSVISEWISVAIEHFKSVSKHSAYKDSITSHIKMLEKAKGIVGLQPIVVAKTIQKAIFSRKAKARYIIGKDAKALLILKRIIPDKIFDKIIISIINK